MVIPLKSLINKLKGDNEFLQQTLSSFSCKQDTDIAFFLHNRAIEFETLAKARTYLIIDEEILQNGNFLILGYFSLALKTLSIPEELSNRARKELDGFSGKFHGKPIQNIPCYLIGQLAKNSTLGKTSISGNFILNKAYDTIAAAVALIGGRYIMVECHTEPKLIKFYQDNLFHEITRIADGKTPMIQMIRKI